MHAIDYVVLIFGDAAGILFAWFTARNLARSRSAMDFARLYAEEAGAAEMRARDHADRAERAAQRPTTAWPISGRIPIGLTSQALAALQELPPHTTGLRYDHDTAEWVPVERVEREWNGSDQQKPESGTSGTAGAMETTRDRRPPGVDS